MARLGRGLSAGGEGQAHHQGAHIPLVRQGQQPLQVSREMPTMEGGKGGDREAEWIAASQADAPTTDVEGEHGAGRWGRHSALRQRLGSQRGGQRPAPGLQALQHRREARGDPREIGRAHV